DDDGAALERRPDHLRDVLRAVGGIEQRLGARAELGVVPVEQNLPQVLADGGRTRLERQHDFVTTSLDLGRDALCLGRLAGSLPALEDEELPGGRAATGFWWRPSQNGEHVRAD